MPQPSPGNPLQLQTFNSQDVPTSGFSRKRPPMVQPPTTDVLVHSGSGML